MIKRNKEIAKRELTKYENGTLIPVSDDRLLDNSTPEYGRNSIELAVTDAYETITQIALKKATDPDTLRIMNPRQIVYEGERRADLYDKENDKEKYFCYVRGSLVDIYDELYEAVNTVKDGGLVTEEEIRTWKNLLGD